MQKIEIITPNNYLAENHWYPKALNATIHPMVSFFLTLSSKRIVSRYCHLHPRVSVSDLSEILDYRCKYFLWSGADLINATSAEGSRKMVVIENNSCPSGQKSMPLVYDDKEEGSYRLLIERTFAPYIKPKQGQARIDGRLAILYDKNYMEVSGYAAVIANVFQEDVYLVSFHDRTDNSHLRIDEGVIKIKDKGTWVPIRAVFRYVTQKPWNRLPLHLKTKILNPIVVCLAGGRNKMMAAKAYDLYNSELRSKGLRINMPETIWDISKDEIPLWVQKLGGHAVVKIPYSNAGQGVFTITNGHELDNFMKMDFDYNRFIVQSLIGNFNWSSRSSKGKFYQVGTIPNQKGETYVADLRLMVSSTENGIRPLCVYGRRAAQPLVDVLTAGIDSWDMLGTNLSIKLGENEWSTDTNRLVLMDRRDFNKLGLGLDDLVEAYIQTVLSTIAIDKMCQNLFNSKGRFRHKLFKSLNNDSALLSEICS